MGSFFQTSFFAVSFSTLLLTSVLALAGEKPDSPMSNGVQNGFGAMVFDSRESLDAQTVETNFLNRIEATQDEQCKQSSTIELRRLVFLEWRKFLVSKSLLEDQEVSLADLKRFSHFLAEAHKVAVAQPFQVSLPSGKVSPKSSQKFQASHNNVQQFLAFSESIEGKTILNDSSVRLGALAQPVSMAQSETISHLKALQIQAQSEPGSVVKECRSTYFSGESSLYLSQEMRSISKCTMSSGNQCFAKWLVLCPSLQLSLMEDLLNSQETRQKLVTSLPDHSPREWACASSLNAVAKEIVNKDLLNISTFARQ